MSRGWGGGGVRGEGNQQGKCNGCGRYVCVREESSELLSFWMDTGQES